MWLVHCQMKHGGYEYFMYRAVISCHMLKLKLSSATSWGKAERNQTLQSTSSDAFTSVFLIPDVSLLTQEQSNLLLVLSIHCVFALSCDKAEAIPSFNVLSSKMCSAIFTSCFELTCVSCPLTKQKLADLMCITQLKKKIRQGFRYAKQSEIKRIYCWLVFTSWCAVIEWSCQTCFSQIRLDEIFFKD